VKRMHSLFFKIFGWFWLAVASLLVIVVSIFMVVQKLGQDSTPRPEWTALQAGLAAEAYDRGGPAEFGFYAARVESLTNLKVYLLDERGRDVMGRPVPRAVTRPLDRAAHGAAALRTNQDGYDVALRPVRVGAGTPFTYVTVRPQTRSARLTLPGPESVWFLLVAAILTAGLVCYWLARSLTAPIRSLTSATRRLAAGELDARATGGDHRHDEIADLGRQFNLMAERLESLVTSQRELLRNVSHELRSPLARLNVALGLARRTAEGETLDQLDRIEREADRLNQLIGQLLTLSRLEAGDPSLERRPVPLNDLVETIAEDARFEAGARGIRVVVEHGQEGESVNGVPELLRSALENVVRNALRYAPEGSAVEMRVNGGSNGHATVSIRDHGPGVPDDELPNLFRPFHRVDAARDQRGGGAGLGLAIVQRSVELHGGRVTAKNAAGGGLVIDIDLPRTA